VKYLFLDIQLKANTELSITDKQDINYIVNVLRFKKGQKVTVLDGEGLLTHSEITLAHKKEVLIQTTELIKADTQNSQINLYFGIPNKLPKLELMLKMATELGVSNFYPLHTEYSQVTSLGKQDRLLQIIKSAASQSESSFLPKLHEPQKLSDLPSDRPYLACVCRMEASTPLLDLQITNQANILIGPEGGFSSQDRQVIFEQLKAQAVSLGEKVLRLETASLLALGICALKISSNNN